MPRTTYYTATSLDGFIADPEATLDWLLTRENDADGLLNYDDFIRDVGAVAMGRTTYEWVLDHEGPDAAWPYTQPAWVFTHHEPRRVEGDIRFTQADVATVHAEMAEAAGDRGLWVVGGGDLAGQFADAGLLDEVVVYVAPVFLGDGAPLFPRRQELRLVEVGRNQEFAAARYEIVK